MRTLGGEIESVAHADGSKRCAAHRSYVAV
jgi:hypothetical protein